MAAVLEQLDLRHAGHVPVHASNAAVLEILGLRVPHDPERGTALTVMTSDRLYWFERFRTLTS